MAARRPFLLDLNDSRQGSEIAEQVRNGFVVNDFVLEFGQFDGLVDWIRDHFMGLRNGFTL